MTVALVLFLAGCDVGNRRANIFLDPGQEAAADTSVLASERQSRLRRAGGIEQHPLQRVYVPPGNRTVRAAIDSGKVNPLVAPLRGEATQYFTEGDITLNFEAVSVQKVVQTILGDILQTNFTIDPTVSGTVTLQTNRPVSGPAALGLLEEVLALNGAELTERGGVYFVEANPDVRGTRDIGSIEIVNLEFAEPEAIIAAVTPFLTPETTAIPLQTQPGVALSGPPRALRRISAFVRALDIDSFVETNLIMIPLGNADATEVVAELQIVFEDADDDLRIIPVQRINAILAASRNPTTLVRVRRWIANLDQSIAEPVSRIYVYEVEHLEAAQLAETLQKVFAEEESALEVQDIAPGFTPETASSDEGAAPFPAPDRPSPVAANARIRITPDEDTNTLLIRALPEDYDKILDALRVIDRPPLQVMLETTIAEVTLNDDLRYGVEWFLRRGDLSLTRTGAATGAVLQNFPGASLFLDTVDFDVVISALDSVSDVEIISSPTLLARDNETARLQVGDEVPVVTQTLVAADAVSTIANTVEYRNAGIILEFTPRITAGGVVALKIRQEVSDVAETTTSGIDSPTIRQRSFTSSVVVEDGQTIALGGLIRRNTTRSEDGIPLLSDIPTIGEIFKSTDNSERRTELLVMIRPKVIYDYSEAAAVTQELQLRLRRLQNRSPQSLFEADRPPRVPARGLDVPALLEGVKERFPAGE